MSKKKIALPNHVRKLHYLHRIGALRLDPGSISQLEVRHDDWCRHWDGKACNCNPDVRQRWEVPAGSQN
jgi:hypothetical protein